MNLTMPNYFKLVGFHCLQQKEQIMHLLFFVTVVAELRKDMTAKIITDRLNDQRQMFNSGTVQHILETDHHHFQESVVNDQRDRRQGEKAYHLTETAKKQLIKAVNIRFAKIRYWSRPAFFIPFLLGMALTVVAIGMLIYHVATIQEISDLSWSAYRSRTHLDTVSDHDKSRFVLYFITEHIKYRSDMTPLVISERLQDLGYGHIDSQLIESYFKNNPSLFVQSQRPGAYSLTVAGVDTVREKLSFNPSEHDGIFALKWFVEYELQRASLMLPALIAGALFIWVAAAAHSKLEQWAEKLVPEQDT